VKVNVLWLRCGAMYCGYCLVAAVQCHVLWLLSCGCGAVPCIVVIVLCLQCGAMYCGRLVTAFQTNLLGVSLPSFSLKMYIAHIWSTKIHGVTSQKIQILVVSVIRNLRYQSHLITFFALMNKGISFHYSEKLHRSLVCCLCPFC